MWASVRGGVQSLTPGYFSLVMASGILSLGFDLVGWAAISQAFFVVTGVAYVLLLVLNGWRLVAFWRAVVEDFQAPRRAFGFFTFVAGTNVLGARAGAQGWFALTGWLLLAAGSVWIVLGYVIPWSAVLGRDVRPVVALANGTWFVWVVASQSVAVSAATLEGVVIRGRELLAILAVLSWSVGVFLYVASAIIVSLRLMLYRLDPVDLDPPYWVAMGAVAITVVAGARIVDMQTEPMVDVTRGLIAGLSVMFWAFATWLIPVLVAAGVWRHVVRRVAWRYEATLWSMVFPLGMYAVAGIYLGRADRLPVVEWIGVHWLYVAGGVWAVVLVAMLRHLGVGLRRS